MNINIAFSPCPNDTFMLDALVHKRIDTGSLEFTTTLADIQELNQLAASGDADMLKISYAAYPSVSSQYQLLTAGSALGRGVGPLLVSRLKINPFDLDLIKIAIPGELTTANLLLTMLSPSASNKAVYHFSQIEDVVMSYEVEAGTIIHEGRFTYKQTGLRLIMDLGEFWEQNTGLPIPLGGIAIKRSLPDIVKKQINSLVQQSTKYAILHPSASYPFVSKNAQSLDDEVLRGHIELYVNSFTQDLGEEGKRAVMELFRRASKAGFCQDIDQGLPVFVE